MRDKHSEWHNLAFTFDSNAVQDTAKILLDGAEVQEQNSYTDLFKFSNNHNLVVGDWRLDVGDHYTDANFKGMIDELGIYSTAVSDDQIKRMNDAGKVMFGDWADGKYGTALELDGDDDYVIVPMDNFPTDELTVEFWMKSSDNVNQGTPISYTVNGANDFLIFDYNNFDIYVKSSPIPISGGTGISANDGNWHHIAVTWKSSDGNVTIYKDGNSVYSGTRQEWIGPISSSSGMLVIGQDQDNTGGGFDPSQAFNGLIDEVRISNYARYE